MNYDSHIIKLNTMFIFDGNLRLILFIIVSKDHACQISCQAWEETTKINSSQQLDFVFGSRTAAGYYYPTVEISLKVQFSCHLPHVGLKW